MRFFAQIEIALFLQKFVLNKGSSLLKIFKVENSNFKNVSEYRHYALKKAGIRASESLLRYRFQM